MQSVRDLRRPCKDVGSRQEDGTSALTEQNVKHQDNEVLSRASYTRGTPKANADGFDVKADGLVGRVRYSAKDERQLKRL